ncbi:MAG: fumarylacetoacetate hydrolase family protein [Acidimicrobiales bacterium]
MKLADHAGRATLVTATDPAMGVDVFDGSDGRLGPDVQQVYDRWAEFERWAGQPVSAPSVPIELSKLGPPAPRPRQVFAIGLNYRRHAEETGATLPPIPATFTKFPACLTGPEATVVLPSANVDWEVELVVVIGRQARHVAEAEAWSHVAGLTIGQDLSERVVQRAAGSQFSLGKSYEGFGPMGPWVVTPDEFADPDDLAIGCSVDGEVVQDARTSDLVFDVASLIAQLSAVVSLLPGDVIFTGTPSGVGTARIPPRYLQAGQVLESWIEGIGRMRTHLVAAPRALGSG